MAKLYYTKEIAEIFDNHIKDGMMRIFEEKELTEEQVTRFIKEMQIFRKYADEIIEIMEEADRKDEKERAEWKAKKEQEAQQEQEEPEDGAGSRCPVDSGSGE